MVMVKPGYLETIRTPLSARSTRAIAVALLWLIVLRCDRYDECFIDMYTCIHSLYADITCTHDYYMHMFFFCLIPTSAELAVSNVGNLLICLEKASCFLAGHWSISKLGCFWIQCSIYLDLLLAIWDFLIALPPLPTKRIQKEMTFISQFC